MPLKKGEVYRCPDDICGCEVTVIKGTPSDCSQAYFRTMRPSTCGGHIVFNSFLPHSL